MDRLPDLSSLSHDEKDALIHALWAQVQALTARVAELEAGLAYRRRRPTTPACRHRRAGSRTATTSLPGPVPARAASAARAVAACWLRHRTRLSPPAHPDARTARRHWTRPTRRWLLASIRSTCRWSPR